MLHHHRGRMYQSDFSFTYELLPLTEN